MSQTDILHFHTIGVAGHIDHGKTTLIKALTGVDTDRLKEEKERGISIELGFAPCKLPGGAVIGVVDVPGHERFIRQMIAGAAGIDMVLLVIAADEGIMPQTREHADILQLLGITRGIIVLTKVDTVEEEWLAMVQEEVVEWAKKCSYAQAPVVAVSSRTGEGIDQLRALIEKELCDVPVRKRDSPARIPIDRVFKVKGAGTVVTGTMYEGTVSEGDFLEILPGKEKVRVRRLHVHNRQVQRAYAGERVAVNITGGDSDEVVRGMTLARTGAYEESQRIDIRFSMLKSASFSLKQRSRVRVHMGTSEVMGTIIFFDRNVIQAGEETFCQLLLEEPVVTKKGEPLIIRRLSPMTTIGGGRVIDPYAERHRFGQQTLQRLTRMAEGNPQELLVQYLEQVEFATIGEVLRRFAHSQEELETLVNAMDDVLTLSGRDNTHDIEGTFFLLTSTLERWKQLIVDELETFHENYPLRTGMDKAALKSAHFKRLPDKLWRVILDITCQTKGVQEANNFVFRSGFTPSYPQKYREQIEQAILSLKNDGWSPPAWEILMQEFRIPADAAGDLKAYLLHSKEIIPLAEDLYIDKEVWEKGVERLKEHCGGDQIITPAGAKDALGLSRKYLIPFLESLDRERLTRRVEEGWVWVR